VNAPTRALRAYHDALAALHDSWLSLSVTATWLSRCTQPFYRAALPTLPLANAEDMLRLLAIQAGALQQHAAAAADLVDVPVVQALYAAAQADQPSAVKLLGSGPWHALLPSEATYLLGQQATSLCGITDRIVIAAARPPNCERCLALLSP